MKQLNIRKIPDDVHARFKAGAGARQITDVDYFVKLVRLHELVVRACEADHPKLDDIKQIVSELGLAGVRR